MRLGARAVHRTGDRVGRAVRAMPAVYYPPMSAGGQEAVRRVNELPWRFVGHRAQRRRERVHLGRLHAPEQMHADAAELAFETAWNTVPRKNLRRWVRG